MLFFYRFSFCSFTASFNRLVSVYQLDATETFTLPDITEIIALPKSQKHRTDRVGKDLWRSNPSIKYLIPGIKYECLSSAGLLKALCHIYSQKCFLVNELLSFLIFYEHLLGLC